MININNIQIVTLS